VEQNITWEPGDPRDRSILGFRCRHGGSRGPMSKSLFHKMKNAGLGPRETHLYGKTIITVQDELAWDAARATPKGAEAREVAEAAAWRSTRARTAAAIAIKSPTHPCNLKRAARTGA
jgi:hypothetical protein